MEAAIAEVDSLMPCEEIPWTKIAKKHGVVRSTLTRRYRHETESRASKHIKQQALTPHEEADLVDYIEELTRQYLPPTREMIQNFASAMADNPVSESWVTRFLHRHSDQLSPQWTTTMAAERHAADSGEKYKLYFDMLQVKMEEYGIEAEHTYNMDEKGFMIGAIGRSKRIFSKSLMKDRRFRQALEDGNREWITLMACVGASGVALPPALIYPADSKKVQSSWVSDIDARKHHVYVAVTPSGWSNDEVAIAWLQQVFDVATKASARRKWRLLVIDGHGSHITKRFLTYCHKNKILVAVFPPHSTHTLQPLDVVMFKPLATTYSKNLTQRASRSKGLLAVKKGDFFSLFWDAWTSSFTETNIHKAFAATGIHPLKPDVILKRFATQQPEAASLSATAPVHPIGQDWRRIVRQLDAIVKDNTSEEATALRQVIHHISTENELLHYEKEGLEEALKARKKQKKKSHALDLQKHEQNLWGGANFWSPRSMAAARRRERILKEMQHGDELKKAEMKDLKAANKLYNNKIDEEKRQQRAREKEARAQAKAEERQAIDARKAARATAKQARDAAKALQQSQRGNRITSQAPKVKQRPARHGVGARSRPKPVTPPPPAHTHTTRSGRVATLYK